MTISLVYAELISVLLCFQSYFKWRRRRVISLKLTLCIEWYIKSITGRFLSMMFHNMPLPVSKKNLFQRFFHIRQHHFSNTLDRYAGDDIQYHYDHFRWQLPITNLCVHNHWPYSSAVCSLVFRLCLTHLGVLLIPQILLPRHSGYQKCHHIYANTSSVKYQLVQQNILWTKFCFVCRGYL